VFFKHGFQCFLVYLILEVLHFLYFSQRFIKFIEKKIKV